MNKYPSRETVKRLREQFPKGCRIELIHMDDPFAELHPGDLGTVDFVDDGGTIFCTWDNQSTLGVVFGVDALRRTKVGLGHEIKD
jgi:hypothetical protein